MPRYEARQAGPKAYNGFAVYDLEADNKKVSISYTSMNQAQRDADRKNGLKVSNGRHSEIGAAVRKLKII